ncbi:Coiled-coil domain-containing protein 15 [Eumeta japonica]|uniref:Coiled-coil domain-containing protein 15 n=1 Tax=Eumeta variegata TaxID=151549 RepID=A0A4C1SEH6_EUMVA|nr:Coiled-coil domain-containing protein 15 [Eumeta japonica]
MTPRDVAGSEKVIHLPGDLGAADGIRSSVTSTLDYAVMLLSACRIELSSHVLHSNTLQSHGSVYYTKPFSNRLLSKMMTVLAFSLESTLSVFVTHIEDLEILINIKRAPALCVLRSWVLCLKSQVCGPKGSDCVLKDSDCVPKGSDLVPKGSDCVPKGSDLVPKGSDCVPKGSDLVPKGSDLVPKGSDCVPKGSDCVPKGSDLVPKGSDYVPKGSDLVPKDSDLVPKDSDCVPKSLDLVPKGSVCARGPLHSIRRPRS